MSVDHATINVTDSFSFKRVPRPSGPTMRKAPLSWRVINFLVHRLKDLPRIWVAKSAARILHVAVATSQLYVVAKLKDGTMIDYGLVSTRLVTTAGVTALAANWASNTGMGIFKYHGAGTGNTAAAIGDTTLQTEATTTLNPDNTRATGSLGASVGVLTTIGTLLFDGVIAVVEWGLFNQAATGGGTLFDRFVFSVQNYGAGDSMQGTVVITFTAGG